MGPNSVMTINAHDKSELTRFVTLERKLMEKYPHYCSEIDSDVMNVMQKKSSFSGQLDLRLFIASKGHNDVARCAAIINKKYQSEKERGVGFIGFFAAAEDCSAEVAHMIGQAEQWLKENGVTRIIAPCNGGAPQNLGFLVAGFDESPMFPFLWTPPYYNDYIKSLRYNPTYPLWYYEIDFTTEAYKKAKQRYSGNHTVRIRPVSKKNWDRDLEIMRLLFNETFKDEWEFSSLSTGEMKEFFGQMKPILDSNQMQIAEVDGKPVGFCLGMPDLTPLFRSFEGTVGLMGIVKLLMKGKAYKRAGILGIGVLPEYRGQGISKGLAMKVYSHHEEKGMSRSFYYPVNERNAGSRGFAESLGGKGHVRYQVYDKVLQ